MPEETSELVKESRRQYSLKIWLWVKKKGTQKTLLVKEKETKTVVFKGFLLNHGQRSTGLPLLAETADWDFHPRFKAA